MSEKIESVKVTIVGKQGKPVQELIPAEWLSDFTKNFGKGVPHLVDFEKWKETMMYNSEKTAKTPEVYKIIPSVRRKIHNYLNTRPMDDVVEPNSGVKLENLILGMFEVVIRDEDGKPVLGEDGKEQPVDDPYYTEDGIKLLVGYLRQRCPRQDTKPLIEDLMNGGIQKYEIVDKSKADTGDEVEMSVGGKPTK